METLESGSHSFVNRLLITMALKVVIGTFLTAINKGFVLKKGLTTPFCWINVNGQRFYKQKRIETKTEQCERSLRRVCAKFYHIFL